VKDLLCTKSSAASLLLKSHKMKLQTCLAIHNSWQFQLWYISVIFGRWMC